VKFLGDGAMAEFGSGRAAVAAAGALHEAFDHPLHVGIHVGDVESSDGDLLGDGVNVAARLQDLAEAGEILVSGAVAFQLRQRTEMEFEPRGEQELKGIGPVRVFAVSVVEPIDPGEVHREEAEPWWSRFGLRVLAASALVVAIILGWFALGGEGTPEATASSIAVLPFETVGEANPTFASGIHGDVLTHLSSISGLDVISRASVMRYRGQGKRSPEIARELGTAWLLQGEVQQVGEQVRVNARLVDAREDRQVWAEGFRRELTTENLFDIQQEITLQIAAALETRLTPGERRAVEREPTDDLEAYRLYAQGRELLDPRTEESMRRAVGYFERAIDRDPDYAAAWAGLAEALALLESYAYPTPEGSIEPERAALRALELEPDLSRGHVALAILAHLDRDNAAAIERLQRAVELRPSYAQAHNLLSWMYLVSGRAEAAYESAKRAVELDPLGPEPLSNLAFSHLVNGRPEEAIGEARRLQDLAPEYTTGPFYEALALYHLGEFSEARPLLEDLPVAWAGAGSPATLALVQIRLGDAAAARETLAGIDASAHPFSAVLVRAALGEVELDIEDLERIDSWEYWPTLAVRYFFPEELGALRADPDYEDLLREVDRSWGVEG
ncbi:MAG: adenylate/guanylate cyclase domain-containing protein, partial [Gemmatimonadota bacterium]|nr:adenylate/guanylate cyclase domain-containing protein [Gemmatimonadota bacterium]